MNVCRGNGHGWTASILHTQGTSPSCVKMTVVRGIGCVPGRVQSMAVRMAHQPKPNKQCSWAGSEDMLAQAGDV